MMLLLIFSFLAGIVTILSPCILPILPIVLSGSITGGKRRPIGVVAGFIFSFTFFTLFLASIVKATGLSADVLRSVSVFIVAVFGISLLIPQFQVLLERLFSILSGWASQKVSRETNPKTKAGFMSGLLIGVSLGLVWTPCVGPILASIITIAATSSVSFGAVFITLFYSLGTAIPMLAIIYGGRSLLQKAPWLLSNTGKIQKAFGILMIVTALSIYFNLDRKFQAYIVEIFPSYGVGLNKFQDIPAIKDALKNLESSRKPEPKSLVETDYGEGPELILGGRWFNSEPLTIKSLRGKVVLVDFWTYTCINCIRTLPYLKKWHKEYKDKGLVIIGVHTPEFEFEKNPDNVQKAIKDFSLEYPIMQDNEYATWRAYNNRYWPAEYFIDKNGHIRRTHFGEGEYDESEKFIQQLLNETGAKVDQPVSNASYQIQTQTPELYLGYRRIEYLSSPEQIQEDKPATYSMPSVVPRNTFAYKGVWTIGDERATPHRNASLVLNFEAVNVYLVMRPREVSGKVRVYLDEKVVKEELAGEDVHDGIITVDTDRLYKLIKLTESSRHVIRLEFLDDNVEVFAFTFG